MAEFSVLQGLTLKSVEQIGDDVIRFEADDGRVYEMFHEQECCESVIIEDVYGDYADLVGVPILLAEEAVSGECPDGSKVDDCDNSNTWTFYKLRTIKGSVDIRWHGSSNGYYREAVDFEEIKQ